MHSSKTKELIVYVFLLEVSNCNNEISILLILFFQYHHIFLPSISTSKREKDFDYYSLIFFLLSRKRLFIYFIVLPKKD